MISDDDLKLIGGDFLTDSLPPSVSWLGRYFQDELTYRYIVYRFVFAKTRDRLSYRKFAQLFVDHTGFFYNYQRVFTLEKKIKKLCDSLDEAVAKKNFELVSKIKLGSYFDEDDPT